MHPGARRLFCARAPSSPAAAASPATRSPRSTAPRSRRTTSSTGSPSRQVRRSGHRGGAQAARLRGLHQAEAKTTPKPAKGQPKVTDSQLKTQCKQEYDALRDQVLQLLISFEWIEGEADLQKIKVSDAEVKKSFDKQKKEAFPKAADFDEVPQGLGPDRGRHPPARPPRHPLHQDPREGDQGQGQGHRRPDRGVLRQEQGPLRAARAARPADRPDQDAGQGRGRPRRRSTAAESFKSVAKKYSIDQASKAQGGKLPAVAKGQQEKALDDGDLQGQEGRADRPGQDPVRLLRLRGHQDHPGLPADAGAGQGDDQADARLPEPAEGARQVRQVLPQALEGRRRTAARATARRTARTPRRRRRRRRRRRPPASSPFSPRPRPKAAERPATDSAARG